MTVNRHQYGSDLIQGIESLSHSEMFLDPILLLVPIPIHSLKVLALHRSKGDVVLGAWRRSHCIYIFIQLFTLQ